MKFKKGSICMFGKRKVTVLCDVDSISQHVGVKIHDTEVYAMVRAYNLRLAHKTIDRL